MGRAWGARTGSLLVLAVLNAWGHLHHHHHHHHHLHDGARRALDAAGHGGHAFWCGADDPEDMDALVMDLKQEEWEYKQTLLLQSNGTAGDDAASAASGLAVPATGNNQQWEPGRRQYLIPVFFSVLAESDTKGRMTDEGLQATIKVLNRVYKNTNFQFRMRGVQRRMSADWHNCSLNDQNAWKRPLHVGGSNALNIYICNPNRITHQGTESIMGVSTWPTDANRTIDGVMVVHPYYYGTLAMHYFLVHETGHWLGLLHTFANGCSSRSYVLDGMTISDGDGVADTPAQRYPTWDENLGNASCWQDLNLNTCNDTLPGIDHGLDPIKNYMNYVDPQCWAEFGEFTPGQHRRMLALYEEFRLSNVWKCTPAGQKCRRDFDCCGRPNYACVHRKGRRSGVCTKTCADKGAKCQETAGCCGSLTCRGGSCKA